MAIILCRTCGRELSIPDAQEIVCCPACSTNNCLPQESDVGDVLNRATGQRLRCDFVHAEASYQYVLNISPGEHEALWGLVQCRYGVQYVDDPRTGKPMPIVHAVRKRPMLTDPDFREACELAPEEVRQQYRKEARYIDDAMTKIRELAVSGETYDIFLCHKTSRTDGQGGYTEDFKRATDLFIRLKDLGYRVFFAPFAGLLPGENYEAGIYHALCTSKVMLLICSRAEYITSPWVRTEWQRFLEMSYEDGADKHLIPLLYESFPPHRLPDDFRHLQAIAMGELNAAEQLFAAVEKHVGPQAATPPAPPQGPAYAPASHFSIRQVEGGVRITRYLGPGEQVLIPPEIDGQTVAEIGAKAFQASSVTKVGLPGGVRSIGDGAFSTCHDLTEISLPQGLSAIGEKAFYDCTGLKSVALPSSVTDLGSSAFQKCSALRDISLPAGVKVIADNAFNGCSDLRALTLPEGVTAIGDWAFCGCSSLTGITLPQSLTAIGELAFFKCSSLTGITLPRAVSHIGDGAFLNSAASGMTLRVHADTYAHRYAQENRLPFALLDDPQPPREKPARPASNQKSEFQTQATASGLLISKYNGPGGRVNIPAIINGKKVELIGEKAFWNSAVTHVNIPAGVTAIGDWAFHSCTGLVHISLPGSLTDIGDGAFSDCTSLQEISIPDKVTNIRWGIFKGCTSLSGVHGLKKITHIGDWAFHGCTSLTDITLPATVESIDSRAFFGCSNLRLIVRPESHAHRYARENDLPFMLSSPAAAPKATSTPHKPTTNPPRKDPVYAPEAYFQVATAKSGVRIVKYTGAAREVNIPPTINGEPVTEIANSAFENNSTITAVSFPTSISLIGAFCFRNCTALASVTIPEGVQTIGNYCFSSCTSLQRICLPEGLITLGWSAFELCAGLKTAILPQSLTVLEEQTFRKCTSLQSVKLSTQIRDIGSNAFVACSQLRTINLPDDNVKFGTDVFRGCTSLDAKIRSRARETIFGLRAFTGF